MKKILLSVLTLSAVVLVACGPSKTYTEAETAAKAAKEQLAAATDGAALEAVQANWAVAVEAAAALEGEELANFETLKAEVSAIVMAKSDSLKQVATALQAQADSLAAAAAALEAAPVKK